MTNSASVPSLRLIRGGLDQTVRPKTAQQRLVEFVYDEPLQSLLPRLADEHDSVVKMAEAITEAGVPVSWASVARWCAQFGVRTTLMSARDRRRRAVA